MNNAITYNSETITYEQMATAIDILFHSSFSEISNWQHNTALVINLMNAGFSVNQINIFINFILERLHSYRDNNNRPINLNSGQRLIDLVGESNFANMRQELINAALNIVNAQIQAQQSAHSTNFPNNQTQNQFSSNFYSQMIDWSYEMLMQAPPELRTSFLNMGLNIGMNYFFNQNRPQNSANNIIPTNSNQNFSTQQVSPTNQIQYQPQPYQTSQTNQNSEIDKLVNFLASILNGSYWQGNTRINLETLRDLNFNVGQIRTFINRLGNANSIESMRISNYQSVENLILKIGRKAFVTVEDVANVLLDLSEIYPDINRNEQVPLLARSQERPR